MDSPSWPAWRLSSCSERALAFGPFRLIPSQKLLLESDKPVRLGSRALELLIAQLGAIGK
jgi:DNA-binding winged helix-turn-helix (wHTH) protein